MVVAGHDDDGLLVAREVPEPWQRHDVARHACDQVREQPLLLVGLRDGDLVEIDPVRRRVARLGAEEEVVRANRRNAVALLSGPGRSALARVDDGLRQVERERRRLTAGGTDGAERDRRVDARARRSLVEGRDRGRAGEPVPGRRAVELDAVGDDACTGRARRELEVLVFADTPRSRDAEQAEELRVGPHGDQVAAGGDPACESRHLRARERRLAEDDDVVVREQRRVECRYVRRRIGVQSFGLKNLGQVARELVARGGDDQDRAARRRVCRGRSSRRGAASDRRPHHEPEHENQANGSRKAAADANLPHVMFLPSYAAVSEHIDALAQCGQLPRRYQATKTPPERGFS